VTHANSSNRAPSWSPDGTQIVYEKDEFFGHDTDLYSIAADGGTETLLSGLDWPQGTPALQPTRS
jgi:Tol biopolymer transport system component